jgi:hypothetical protein
MNIIERTLAFLRRRRLAYKLAFNLDHPAAQMVLEDLQKFCRASEEIISTDASKMAYLEGRRSVWLRIQRHLHLTPEQLMLLYAAPNLRIAEDDNHD